MAFKPKQDIVEDTKAPAMAAVPSTQEVAVPDFLQQYQGPLGTEGIDSEDITIPRLKIAQSLTPQVKDGILQEGSLFINVTSDPVWIPGQPPLPAIIVARSKEFILWRDLMDDGGGILARAKARVYEDKNGKFTRYEWDNQHQSFVNRIGGKVPVTWETKQYVDENGMDSWGSEIPGDKTSGIAATGHHNFLVMLPTRDMALVAISLSKTGVKIAKNINAALKEGRYPIFARQWNLTTVDETSKDRKYKNWRFSPAGLVHNKQVFALAQAAFDEYLNKDYIVEQTKPDEASSSDTGKAEIPF